MLLSASVALTVSTAVRTAVYSPVVTLYVDCEKAGVWGFRTTLMATVAMTDRLGVATSRASTVNYNTQQHGRLQDNNTGGCRTTTQAATGQHGRLQDGNTGGYRTTTRVTTGQQQHRRLQDNMGGYRATPQAATGQQHGRLQENMGGYRTTTQAATGQQHG